MRFKLSQYCTFCDSQCATHYKICDACYHELPWVGVYCIYCANPISQFENSVCGQCIQQKHVYDTLLAPFYYQPPISKLIAALKFKHELGLTKVISKLIIPCFSEYYKSHKTPEIIIPIPLHNARLYQRGFNQSIELAKQLSKEMKVPFARDAAVRSRNTPPQHQLKNNERLYNLHQAFAICDHYNVKHVAVFDDVITTGSTIKAFANELKISGVQKIDVWSVAITLKNVL